MNDQSLKATAKRTLPREVHEGALLAERYRIGRLLGAGGMGAVLAAEHVELNEPVAIKVLLRDAAAQATPEALGRFTREAWAASKIKSEYVARVYDLGKLEDGTPYIVMEYLDGVDLEGLLLEQRRLPLEQALELMLQACEALAEAHALGIFHRDLKPSNLFCIRRSDGLVAIKLLDFGISKISRAADSFEDKRLTGTTSTLGTPLYMSPEQMRSGRVADERSDIWALGVILYEMLSGRVPFNAENLADLAVRVATELPAPILRERPEVPAALERVVMRCLEKDSARRFQSVAELARALAAFGPPRAAAHAERAERILLAKSARGMPTVTTRRSSPSHAGSHARLRTNNADTLSIVTRAKPRTIAIAFALVLLAAVVAVVALRRNHAPAASSTLPPAATAVPNETRANAASALPDKDLTRSPAAAAPTPNPPDDSAHSDTRAAADPSHDAARSRAAEATHQGSPQPPSAAASSQPRSADAAPPAHPATRAASARGVMVAPSAAPAPATGSGVRDSRHPSAARSRDDTPPSAASDSASRAAKRPHARKPAPPAAASPGKDSELDSLGGRL